MARPGALPFLLVLLALVAILARAEEWHEAYRNGVNALARGQGERAVELLERAAAQRPQPGRNVVTYGTNVEQRYYPYLRLAEAYLLLRNLEGARSSLKRSESWGGEPAAARAGAADHGGGSDAHTGPTADALARHAGAGARSSAPPARFIAGDGPVVEGPGARSAGGRGLLAGGRLESGRRQRLPRRRANRGHGPGVGAPGAERRAPGASPHPSGPGGTPGPGRGSRAARGRPHRLSPPTDAGRRSGRPAPRALRRAGRRAPGADGLGPAPSPTGPRRGHPRAPSRLRQRTHAGAKHSPRLRQPGRRPRRLWRRPLRRVPPARAPRPRGHGLRLQGRAAERGLCAQAPLDRLPPGAGVPGAVPARGGDRTHPEPPQHHPHPGAGRRGGRAVLHHGAAPGRDPAGAAQA